MGTGISTCGSSSSVTIRDSIRLNQHHSNLMKLRDPSDPGNNNEVSLDDLERHFFDSGRISSNTLQCLSSRPGTHRQDNRDSLRSQTTLKQNRHSIPSLASFTIKEEDDVNDHRHDGDEHNKTKYKKRQSAKRLIRPKSANIRKRRNNKSEQGSVSEIHEKSRRTETNDGECSDLSDSSDSLPSDFDDDIISIPDETQNTPGRDDVAVKLGPRFVVGDNDWWADTSTEIYDVRQNIYDVGSTILKKASERSISSIILTPVDFSTNNEWFGLTNETEIIRIRQKLISIEDALWEQLTRMSSLDDIGRYEAIIKTTRPQFVKVLAEFNYPGGDVVCDVSALHSDERRFAERLKQGHSTMSKSEFSMMVAVYLQAVEGQLKSKLDFECDELSRKTSSVPSRNCKSAPHAEVVPKAGKSMERKGSLMESKSATVEQSKVISEAVSELESRWLSMTHKELTQLIGAVRDVSTKSNFKCSTDLNSYLKDDYTESLTAEDVFFVSQYLQARQAGTLTKDDAVSSFVRHLTEKDHCSFDEQKRQQQQHQHQQYQRHQIQQIAASNDGCSVRSLQSRPATDFSMISTSHVHANLDEVSQKDNKSTRSRPDSGVVVTSSSASYSSSEAAREDIDVCADTSWITASLDMLDTILQIRTEDHNSIKSLTDAITSSCSSVQLKVHALYRWLASQSLRYYSMTARKNNVPTEKLKALAEGKMSYAALFQEMARSVGLKCEKIEGFAKTKDYLPGSSVKSGCYQHSWNAVSIDDQYRLLDVQFASLPYKFFTEHFFMTPPDEFRLSHFPKDKKWLLMNQSISLVDFEDTLKTWPAMFAFNIRPLSMKAIIRTFDGRLSITVLLRNVAVTPHLQYEGPEQPIDSETLAQNIDTEIRSMDSAETFHIMLPQEGSYYFTLLVHDVEEDEDIPAFQYKVLYKDELL